MTAKVTPCIGHIIWKCYMKRIPEGNSIKAHMHNSVGGMGDMNLGLIFKLSEFSNQYSPLIINISAGRFRSTLKYVI